MVFLLLRCFSCLFEWLAPQTLLAKVGSTPGVSGVVYLGGYWLALSLGGF